MRKYGSLLGALTPSPCLRGSGAAESVHARDDLSCRGRPHAPRPCDGPASCGQLGGDHSGAGHSLATGHGQPLVLGIRCQVHHVGAHGLRAGINRAAGVSETTCSSWADRGHAMLCMLRARQRRRVTGLPGATGGKLPGRGAVWAAVGEAMEMVGGRWRWRAPGPGTQVSTVALCISTPPRAGTAGTPPAWTGWMHCTIASLHYYNHLLGSARGCPGST